MTRSRGQRAVPGGGQRAVVAGGDHGSDSAPSWMEGNALSLPGETTEATALPSKEESAPTEWKGFSRPSDYEITVTSIDRFFQDWVGFSTTIKVKS